MSAYLAEFPKRSSEGRTSASYMTGRSSCTGGRRRWRYTISRKTISSSAGDSVYFDASEAHSYCGQSENPVAKAIIITTPPRM